MGVIGVNGAPFPLVEIDFFAIFQTFLPNFGVMGVKGV